jgi:hypothetical protein
MDPVSLATAFVGAQMGSAQMAVAAKMLRMNADNAASIVEVLNAAQRNIASPRQCCGRRRTEPQYHCVEPGDGAPIVRAPPG